jgi:hypothetical protein
MRLKQVLDTNDEFRQTSLHFVQVFCLFQVFRLHCNDFAAHLTVHHAVFCFIEEFFQETIELQSYVDAVKTGSNDQFILQIFQKIVDVLMKNCFVCFKALFALFVVIFAENWKRNSGNGNGYETRENRLTHLHRNF